MANDIDMWKDIDSYGVEPIGTRDNKISQNLHSCYIARYIDGDTKRAEQLKNKFIKKWGFWGNWY